MKQLLASIRVVFLPKGRHKVVLSAFGSAFSSMIYLDLGLFSVQWVVCVFGSEISLLILFLPICFWGHSSQALEVFAED